MTRTKIALWSIGSVLGLAYFIALNVALAVLVISSVETTNDVGSIRYSTNRILTEVQK